MTTVSGIVRDTEQNAIAGASVSVVYRKPLVGFDGGAVAQNVRQFTTAGDGTLTMADLVPGHYDITIAIVANDSTTETVLRRGTMTVLDQATQTLQNALDTGIGPITPTELQQALNAAASAAASSAAAGAASGRLDVAAFAQLATKFVYADPGAGQEIVAAGDVILWRGEGFAYEVLASGASGADLDYTGSGGVKLEALPGLGQTYDLRQLGVALDGSVDATAAINGLILRDAEVITAPDGSIILLDSLNIAGAITFRGRFELRKATIDDTIITMATGPYTIRFEGVTFNGRYAGAGVEGEDDIAITQSANDGLIIEFIECQHNNISKRGFFSGYLAEGRIKRVDSIKCGGNGNHLHRAANADRSVYSSHGSEFYSEDYKETGDGVFTLSGLSVTRMPTLQLFSTSSKVTIKRPWLRDAGGFLCYRDCDNARMYDPDIDNTGYPFRVQQSANTALYGGQMTNCPFPFGAMHWAPYVRIDTALSRAVEGLRGLIIDGTFFNGNNTDIDAQGFHAQSGGAHGVQDCRARGIRIKAVFSGAVTRNMSMQDADWDARGSDFAFSATQSDIARHVQTAANGAMGADLRDCSFDGTLRNAASGDCVILQNFDITGGVQPFTSLRINGAKMHNMRSIGPMLSLRGACFIDVSDNAFTGVLPEFLVLLRDHTIAKVWDNRGFTYPLGPGNGLVNIGASGGPESIAQLITDAARDTTTNPSFFYSASAPTSTHWASGSIALMPEADADGYSARILDDTTWRRTWKTDEVIA